MVLRGQVPDFLFIFILHRLANLAEMDGFVLRRERGAADITGIIMIRKKRHFILLFIIETLAILKLVDNLLADETRVIEIIEPLIVRDSNGKIRGNITGKRTTI